jgi:hypothetical protein
MIVHPKQKRDVSDALIFDPFPEPQTMPKGWDINGILSTEKLPAVTEATSDTEN